MYQVYTQQRPGRPGLAILSTGLLLLITIGLAWGLILYKSRIDLVPLTEPQVFDAGGIRCRLPSGWQQKPIENTPHFVAAVIEKEPNRRPGRQLYLFRGLPRRLGLPSRDAVLAVAEAIQTLVPGSKFHESGFAQVGPLPGWMIGGSGDSISPAGRRTVYTLATAGVGPQGQVVGAAIISSDEIKRSDRKLLDQICDSLELLDVQTAEPAQAMEAANIQFHAPSDAVFFSDGKSSLPRVQMLGGQEANQWYLDICCVPLIGSRKPADLLTDFAMSLLNQADLPESIETSSLDSRSYAELKLGPLSEGETPMVIGCAQTEEHTGLLLIGRHEENAGKILQQQVRAIARNAKVKPFNQRVNIAAAQEAARQMLKSPNLSRGPDPSEGRRKEYLVQSAAITWGTEIRETTRKQVEGKAGWNVISLLKLRIGDVLYYDGIEDWTIRDDNAAHVYVYHVKTRSTEIQYNEYHEAGPPEVRRDLVVTPGSVRRGVGTPIDDTYCPEPVLLRAAAIMAWEPEAKPLLFSETEVFTKGLAYGLLMPSGQAKPAAGKKNSALAAVQLFRDFDPSPITLYFNQERTLVCIANDSGRWQILEGQDIPADIVR